MIIDIVISGLAVGLIYSLVAMSFTLIFRSSGILNIGQGEFVMLGCLIGYSFTMTFHLNYYLSLLLVIVVVGVLGYMSHLFVFQPIQKRGGGDLHIIIASIGLLLMLPQIGALIWGAEALSYPGDLNKTQINVGGTRVSGLRLLIIVIALLITVVLQGFFRFTRVGQAMRAIADDKVMSQLVGVNIHKYIALIFLIAGALSGVAGIMMGPIYYASFDMGIVGIIGIASAILGGFGNVMGALLGGLLLGLIEAFVGTALSSSYRDVILYGILILVLLIKPSGILGVKQRRDTI